MQFCCSFGVFLRAVAALVGSRYRDTDTRGRLLRTPAPEPAPCRPGITPNSTPYGVREGKVGTPYGVLLATYFVLRTLRRTYRVHWTEPTRAMYIFRVPVTYTARAPPRHFPDRHVTLRSLFVRCVSHGGTIVLSTINSFFNSLFFFPFSISILPPYEYQHSSSTKP